MSTRSWPPELAALQSDPRAVPLFPTNPLGCRNCGGARVMMVFLIQSGPYNQPNGSKVKWLDMPDSSGLKPGWYAGETRYAWCPICWTNVIR